MPLARPTLMAAGLLWDGTDGGGPADTADLLVVAAPGSDTIELVRTWTADNGVDAAQRALLPAGAEILTLAVVPVPEGAGKASGKARVVAALTGARLAIVDYERAPDGAVRRVGPAEAVVQPLAAGGVPFDAVSLAVAPDAPARLFVASPDPIGAVLGVAELDASGAPGSWTVVREIDARAPTRLVAATTLRERTPTGSGGEPQRPGVFQPVAAFRVYAALDPAFCGPEHRVSCGIAVLDPATGGIIPDYSGGMPYLAPILLPGQPVAIVIAMPPANAPPAPLAWEPEFMTMRPESTGAVGTSAVAVVPSTDGRTYYVDLGRWSVPLSASILRTGTRTRIVSVGSRRPTESVRQLGLWLTSNGRTRLVTSAEELGQAVVVTPGFTNSEVWTLRYQDVLPGLGGPTGQEGHRGMTGATGTPADPTWLALQVAEPAPGGGETLTQVVRLYDPALGVRPGDVVSIVVRGGPAECPPNSDPSLLTEPVEATIASVLAPDAARPGGAVTLAPTLTDPRLESPDPLVVEQADDWPACIAALAAGYDDVQALVRAGGLVLTGSVTGLAGRPELQITTPTLVPSVPPSGPDSGSARLEYENEDVLACPVYPWPDDLASAPPEFFTCTGEPCRGTCERLSLARKARRLYHLSDACRPNDFFFDKECNDTWKGYTFPNETGPVIAFTPGYVADPADCPPSVPGPCAVPFGLPTGAPGLRPVLRALEISITTASGISLSSRGTAAGSGAAGTYPMGAATYDRSVVPGRAAESYRFFVPYVSGFVYDFSPAEPLGTAKVVR